MAVLRASIPLALAFSLLLGCQAEIDLAAAHHHDLIDHEYDRQEQLVEQLFELWNESVEHQFELQFELVERFVDVQTQLFAAVLEVGPPAGFGASTCTFTSTPSGASVYQRDFFGEWEYVGPTPLEVERPLSHARPIEVRAPGYQAAVGHMLSEQVRNPCVAHFELVAQ